MKKTIYLAALSILSVLIVFQGMPIAFSQASQTYVPGGEEAEIVIVNILLKNGGSGYLNAGE